MIKLYLSAIILILFSFRAYTQNVAPAPGTEINSDTSTIRGTYQVQVINSRSTPFFPNDLVSTVNRLRKENETVYVTLGTQVKLMILPYAEIRKTGFKPLAPIAHIIE